ncbi:MAG TPA: hypothetical protein VGM54_13410 [Chthoniobacter sp.]|jgi:hypothetical protein
MPKSASAWAEEIENFDCAAIFNARKEAALEACNLVEPQRRLRDIDNAIARDKVRRATFYPGGSLVKVSKLPGYESYEGSARGIRGKIQGFSRKSRLALLQTTAKLDRSGERPKFVTLTYPGDYPRQFTEWKKDLDFFATYFIRRYPGAAFIWKLEPQERGAPHFHLLVWGVPFINKEWLSQTWFQIVGSGDERHLRAGTRVEDIRSWNGVMCYAGKKYMGKECDAPRNWPDYVGRYWGIYGRARMPFAEAVEVTFSARGLNRVHRVLRRYFASKGIDWKTGGGVLLFSSNFDLWLRAFEWAEEGWTHPIDQTTKARQPF